MLTFTLAISCLTTSNLLWFMDLTFQVPMQYCSLQHQTLLLLPVASTTRYCFCFVSIPSFFLELFLHWSPVACWAPTDLGNSSFSILSFCLFILFLRFSRQEYWSGLHFFSPVDHILSDLSTVTHLSFQIGKEVRQGCILSPCLFNLYAEYLMRNAWLEEAQARIKIARRNINNFRYADDTTLMTESEEELEKASWWKWKRRVKKLA